MNLEFRHSLLIVSEQMCIENRGDRGREPSSKYIMVTSQDTSTFYTNFLLLQKPAKCHVPSTSVTLSRKSQEIMTAFKLEQSALDFLNVI